MTDSSLPLINILMGVKNGERFLLPQLESIFNQHYPNLRLWVSDDGSTDNTLPLLIDQQKQVGTTRLSILSGPQRGSAANFLSLILNPNIEGDYFAFCDQDDIWEKDKLTRAINYLKTIENNQPALYCSRTELVDSKGKFLGLSPLVKKKPSFANALVQNLASGNTMVMNKAARNLLQSVSQNIQVYHHDWWAYLVISAVEGKIFYDTLPSLKYRQHSHNLVGANYGWIAKLTRIKLLFKGYLRKWNESNIRGLTQMQSYLTSRNQHIFHIFCAARNKQLLPRVWGLWKAGIYRQTLSGNLGLIVAAIFQRI